MRKFNCVCEGNNQTSGLYATREEAEAWATKKLYENPAISRVFISETVAYIERERPPIKVTDITEGVAIIGKAPVMKGFSPNGGDRISDFDR